MKYILKFFTSKFLWFNILTAIVLSILLCYGLMFWLESYTRHGESVQVPKVTNLYVEEAELLLRELDLSYEIIDSVHKKNMNPGEIAEQTPAPESFVKKNRKIYITVNSRSPRMVIFKDYRGESFRKAQSNYRNQGFKVDSLRFIPSEYSGELLEVEYNGEIITLGKRLPESSNLVLIVGQLDESMQILMPSLYGLSYSGAIQLVKDSTLIVGAINFDEETLTDEDRSLYYVYGQEPKEGTMVNAGKRVDLYFSKDKNKTYNSNQNTDEDEFF